MKLLGLRTPNCNELFEVVQLNSVQSVVATFHTEHQGGVLTMKRRMAIVIPVMLIGIPSAIFCYKWKQASDAHHRQELIDALVTHNLSSQIVAHLSPPASTRVLVFTNGHVEQGPITARDLSQCDITITVISESGEKDTYRKYWESWKRSDTKEITFSNKGKVQRVEVSGKLIRSGPLPFSDNQQPSSGHVATLALAYGFSE